MNILLTNDDGIFAPGIAAIYKKLVELGDVTVAAPADGKSGAGHSITVYEPLECKLVKTPDGFEGYSISGSPADCVKLALIELCDKKPDLVVSGINHGANVGVNVYYSGTVGAAMEGAFYDIPSVAISAARCEKGQVDFAAASAYALDILKKLTAQSHESLVNINIPSSSFRKPKGVKIVPQSTMGFSESYTKQKNDSGQTVFQLTGGEHFDKNVLTDSLALTQGYITITALSRDLTDYKNTEKLHQITW